MSRTLKFLGPVLIAALVLGAVAAAGAGAAEFTSFNTNLNQHEGGTFSGGQTTTHKFTAGAGVGAVTCVTAGFSGTTATGQEGQPTVTPEYKNCHVELLGVTYNTLVKLNGCDYRFHISSGSADDWEGTADIQCAAGKEIDIRVTKSGSEEEGGETEEEAIAKTKCTIKISAQSGLNKIKYHNQTGAAPTDIEVTTETNNLKNTTEGFPTGLGGCGIVNGAHNNGTYTGTTTMKAFGAGTQIDLTVM
jgi:hypothetical protein